ncbi:MAG: MFS transporter [Deinococcota bacterium]
MPITTKRAIFVLGFVSFVTLGIYRSLFGPAFALFAERYAISEASFGLLLSMNGLGVITALSLSGALLPRLSYKVFILLGCWLWALGAWGITLTVPYAWLFVAVIASGWGGGVLDITINVVFTHTFSRAAPLNIVHAAYGVGAIAGPLIVSGFFERGLSVPYGLVAVIVVLLFGGFLWLDTSPVPKAASNQTVAAPKGVFLTMLGFICLYFGYVGIEAGVGSWMSVHLTPSFGAARAASLTSIYWTSLTVGRLLGARASQPLGPAQLLLASTSVAVVGVLICFYIPFAPIGYALVGLGGGPVFPTGLLWVRQYFPARASAMMATVMVAATVGGTVVVWLMGRLVERTSVQAVPSVLFACTLGCLLSVLWLRLQESAVSASQSG